MKKRHLHYYTLAALFLLTLFYLLTTPFLEKSITYDLTVEDTAKLFTLKNAERYDLSAEGLTVKSRKRFELLSPEVPDSQDDGNRPSWQDYPFVALKIDSHKEPRVAYLTWRGNSERRSFLIPSDRDTVLIDTQNFNQPRRWRQFHGPVVRFGFIFSDDITIKKISLLSHPPITERVVLLADQYQTSEPLVSYIINTVVGIYLFGRPILLYAAVLLSIFSLVLYFNTTSSSLRFTLITALILYMILDIQFNLTLIEHIDYSQKRSAWHKDLSKERLSRFNEEFAKLAEKLEETAPKGSKLLFDKERLELVRGETNWISYHFHPDYKSTKYDAKDLRIKSIDLKEADYIFYFYPSEYIYNEAYKVVFSRNSPHMAVKVDLLYKQSTNAMLFKVIND